MAQGRGPRALSPHAQAADILRSRAGDIATLMTMEQGKPLAESKGEGRWPAPTSSTGSREEARRAYGRTVPARMDGVYQLEMKEPVGPVAALRRGIPDQPGGAQMSCAVAAGCSIIVKGPEGDARGLRRPVDAFVQAGIPAGVVNLVFGVPSEISAYLIPHPIIRKISFTGSTAVGKQLAALAGAHMKRVHHGAWRPRARDRVRGRRHQCGGEDSQRQQYRNAGQVCVSPTRFWCKSRSTASSSTSLSPAAKAIKVGDGLKQETRMGQLAHSRRLDAIEGFVADAVARRQGRNWRPTDRQQGLFFEPTVLTHVPREARIRTRNRSARSRSSIPSIRSRRWVGEANRLPYGLAAYAYTRSTRTAEAIGHAIESGMVSINHHGLALPEVRFGGVKDSGFGSEGGAMRSMRISIRSSSRR